MTLNDKLFRDSYEFTTKLAKDLNMNVHFSTVDDEDIPQTDEEYQQILIEYQKYFENKK